MGKTVYIETTIPSFYFNTRPQKQLTSRSEWTREWWDKHRERFDLCTSYLVLSELENGNHPLKKEKIALLKGIRVLDASIQAAEVAEVYVKHFVMPRFPIADALHLALASLNNCHILLTWNCAHLANAEKVDHIRSVNALLGLPVPTLATPLQLLPEDLDES